MANQCKCGGLDFFIEKHGNNTGLYCSLCGKWQKWMNKDEIRAYEHSRTGNKYTKQTNADKIRAMNDEELAVFLNTLFIEGQIEAIHEQYPDSVFNREGDTLRWLKSEAE